MSVADARDLPELLRARTVDAPDATPLVADDRGWTYREIWDGACSIAAGLRARGVEDGTCVVVALPNGIDFVVAFFGVLMAGGAAVPLFPGSAPDRLVRVAHETGALVIVTDIGFTPPPGFTVARVRDLTRSRLDPPRERTRDDLCYVQYTSGSTGEPRGVLLTNECLLVNMEQMLEAMSIDTHDVFVSWLPTYHDMGLTLMLLTPLCTGARSVVLPTALRDVSPWLRAIETYRGTFTAGPDFAYRLCVRAVPTLPAFDLGSLEAAMNASEAVRASTLRDFERSFGTHNVMMTGYGLAEATLSVTCTPRGAPMAVDDRGLVSLGAPLPGVQVEIGDGDEVLVGGPAVCTGYLGAGDASEGLFTPEGLVRTGDVGYVDEHDRLFFVAREKDIIKVAGRTLAPHEVELIVDGLPGVRVAAAVGYDRGDIGGEQLVVFAEVRDPNAAGVTRHDLTAEIAGAVHDAIGVRPQRTYLMRPRTIPLTQNGKVQRAALRAALATGALSRDDVLDLPPAEPAS